MQTISTDDIQRDPRDLLRRVEAGHTLRIVQGGRIVAELRPVAGEPAGEKETGPSTLHDLLAEHIGSVDGTHEALSERCGERFAGGLTEHQRRERR